MAIATLRAKLVADTSQFTSSLRRAQGALGGVGKGFSLLGAATAPLRLMGSLLGKLAGGLLRVGQIAAGIVLAAVFQKAVQSVMNFGKAVFAAVERMQTLRIQISTLAARELSRSINASIEQSVVWRGMTQDGDMLRINIDTLRESIAGYEDVLRAADPALAALLDTQEKVGMVSAENLSVWISTADAFEAATPQANKMMSALENIAIISPFTVDATNNMFRMAQAMGFLGQEALDITEGMLNVAAGLGLTNEQAQRLVLNFSQIRSQGKLTQRDIREMTLTGFQMQDMFVEMNRQLGTNIQTNEDFNKSLERGEFTWAQFTSTFASMADRQFGESAARMAVTIQGIKSSISDVRTIMSSRIFVPAAIELGRLFQVLLDGFKELKETGILDELGEALRSKTAATVDILIEAITEIRELGLGASEALALVITKLEDAGVISDKWRKKVEAVKTFFDRIKATIDGIKSGISGIATTVGNIVGAKMGAARGVETDGTELSSPLEILVGGAMDILAPISVWWTDTFAPVVEDTLARLQGPVMDFITGFVTGFTDTPIPGLLEAITGAIAKIDAGTLEAVADAIVKIATFLADNAESIGMFVSTFLILAGLASAISAVAGAIGGIVTFIGGLGGVMGALGALVAFIGGPVTLVIAAVALALVAWQQNWGGIQDKVGSVIDFLKGKFEEVKAKFEEIKDKMVSIWEEHLAPIWDSFMGVIEAAVVVIQDIIDIFTMLRDIVIEVGTAIIEKLRPHIEKIVDGVVGALTPVVDLFTEWWDVIAKKLTPVIMGLRDLIAAFIKDKLDKLRIGLKKVKTVLQGLHDLFKNFKDALSNFRLPDFLQMHSPPPLADALNLIADGLARTNKGFGGMRGNMEGLARNNLMSGLSLGDGALARTNKQPLSAAEGDNIEFHINVENINNDQDVRNLAYEIAALLRE